jgi:hypothetical protein
MDRVTREAIAGTLRGATYDGRDERGGFHCSAVVFYGDSLFLADFTIYSGGMIEMADDEPITKDLPVHIHAPIIYEKPKER